MLLKSIGALNYNTDAALFERSIPGELKYNDVIIELYKLLALKSTTRVPAYFFLSTF